MRILLLTTVAMLFFAANSLLCRAALRDTTIDAATFTSLRIISGALMLWLIVQARGTIHQGRGNWVSALALVAYAAGFSFAYLKLTAGTGALLLVGAVQVSMLGYGVWKGERLRRWQPIGLLLASAGMVGLLLPGLSAPPLIAALLMLGAGISWGVYSLRGKVGGDPTCVTAGNFLRAVPIVALMSLLMAKSVSLDMTGMGLAITSGAITAGIGYAIWYAVLPSLRGTEAAIVQLSFPVIAALGGILLLGEPLTLRLVFSSIAILGGIALVIIERQFITQRSEAA